MRAATSHPLRAILLELILRNESHQASKLERPPCSSRDGRRLTWTHPAHVAEQVLRPLLLALKCRQFRAAQLAEALRSLSSLHYCNIRPALFYVVGDAQPQVWFQDLACHWHFLAASFADFFRSVLPLISNPLHFLFVFTLLWRPTSR